MRTIDHTGKKFARLTVIEQHGKVGRRVGWMCRCDCGAMAVVAADKLTSGHTRSCGCLMGDKNRELRLTHGHSSRGRSRTYKSWCNIIQRCENPNNIRYKSYGGAGVQVCDRWRRGEDGVSGFECFLADMGERPSRKHSIDRERTSGNYEPGNCRWVVDRTQALNRPGTVMIDVGGYEVPLSVACELAGIKYATAWSRMSKGREWNKDCRP